MTTALAAVAGPTQTVIDGPFVVAAGLAMAAGAVSFASPCVIPLVPGYLSYLVGLVGAEGSSTQTAGSGTTKVRVRVRSRVVGAASLFVIGFTLVFLAEQSLVLGVAHTLAANTDVLMRVGGVVTILMGLAMLGLIRPMQSEKRIHARPTGRVFGALLLGGFFGLGWTVCIGPTLAGVISLSVATDWNGSAWRGIFLVLFYCAGLGVPFLLLAFGFGWASTGMKLLRRHSRTIQVVGAAMLVLVGLAMVTGLWGQFIAWLQIHFVNSGTVL
ncbi:cytochrome c biogenesis CcdA family protein [Nakamurella sp. PAMC28650]|uniref:cytochrome c biogenesis CcdA family protein n=1 Tax=Nakamurella sp. PAMC28650 TaxID=2762325 RepID=UPI0021030FA2|nr:cytochrome c biogenesis CcdA family protein [Nakamurella sp. PAMC28650]